jgi:excisionase family DNA binding protein
VSRLLTPKQVAGRLGCSTPHVRSMFDRRLIDFVEILGAKPGRRMRRVPEESLDDWIRRNTMAATAASGPERG